MRAAPAALLLLTVLSTLSACDGGDNGSPPSSPNPGPDPGTQDPCASVRAEALEPARATPGERKPRFDGSPQWRVLDAFWIHRQAIDRRASAAGIAPPAATASDAGDIAVLHDQGDLIVPANTYDLKGVGLRFTRNTAGGYDVQQADAAFRTSAGTRINLTDDDTLRADVAFAFPFYAGTQRTAFVNSDGNITFGEGDSASTDRSVGRLLTGPPRVALFLSDLDPSAGGAVFLNAAADQHVVTWCGVRGFESTRATTAQVTLLPDGTIEMRYAAAITLTDAVVGLSPGRTADFRPVDLSAAAPIAGGGAAVGERFAENPDLDTVAAARTFYQSHPDAYDQLIFWTDTGVVGPDTFAFESTVANEIQGIGLELFDASREFGSAGRLRSYAVMDRLTKYPDDPTTRFLNENNTVSVLGQEVGHRWLAYLNFRDHTGQRSDALLGRQEAHWSFFLDSDASVLEGNDIEDLGGGSFRTTAAVQRFSRLDQYAMGLVSPAEVPPFFYVESPTNLSQARTRESAPAVGVRFNGTRRDVLIEDIIAIHGARVPPAEQSARIHRQAFVYIVRGATADPGQVAKVDRIRRQWEEFFAAATEGRMRAETRLAQ